MLLIEKPWFKALAGMLSLAGVFAIVWSIRSLVDAIGITLATGLALLATGVTAHTFGINTFGIALPFVGAWTVPTDRAKFLDLPLGQRLVILLAAPAVTMAFAGEFAILFMLNGSRNTLTIGWWLAAFAVINTIPALHPVLASGQASVHLHRRPGIGILLAELTIAILAIATTGYTAAVLTPGGFHIPFLFLINGWDGMIEGRYPAFVDPVPAKRHAQLTALFFGLVVYATGMWQAIDYMLKGL